MAEYKHHSFLDQVRLLKSRGLVVEDEEKAARKLQFINYYKIKELAYPFAVPKGHLEQYKYENISFDLLVKRYYQDKKLRGSILSCVEKIEVAFKTRLCHSFGEHYGAYGYLKFDRWMNKEKYCKSTEMLKNVDDEEKLNSVILSAGQRREVTMLTEDGLYEVLMQSRKPIAKQFKKQVKAILKEIRKTGEYQTPRKKSEKLSSINNAARTILPVMENIYEKMLTLGTR